MPTADHWGPAGAGRSLPRLHCGHRSANRVVEMRVRPPDGLLGGRSAPALHPSIDSHARGRYLFWDSDLCASPGVPVLIQQELVGLFNIFGLFENLLRGPVTVLEEHCVT